MERTGSKYRLLLASEGFVCIGVNKFSIVFTTNRLLFPYQPVRAFYSCGLFSTLEQTYLLSTLQENPAFLMSEFPCVSLTLSQGIDRIQDPVPGPYLVFISVVLFEPTSIQQLSHVSV